MSFALDVNVVIMAGGSGTRFWPLSRKHLPKQLLPLINGQSLLQETVRRVLPLCRWSGLLVVTGQGIAEKVAQQLPQLPHQQLLVEPEGRDTAACVGWVAWRALAAGKNPVLLVLPADHWVGDEEAFRQALAAAVDLAYRENGLVTVGIAPNRPETGYGYLEVAEPAGELRGVRYFPVRRFVEKPSLEKALAFLQAGTYRWNAGIFAFAAQTIAMAIAQHLPELARGLDQLMADVPRLGEEEALRRHYPALPRISLDYGVMEKAERIWAVEGSFPWQDLGSFASFAEVLPSGEAGVSWGPTLSVATKNCVLLSRGPLVATLGLEGMVVVATEDVVLVTPLSHAQKVKELVDLVKKRGWEHLL
jgi:mannose-1-phosphate guanylyltransferase